MVWVSVAWIALEMYVRVTDQYNEKWQYDWIMGDFWYILNFVFLVIIAFLFRPSATSTSYAYSELEGAIATRPFHYQVGWLFLPLDLHLLP